MEKLVIAGREFNSRLFLGTGKFNNNALMAEAIKASETEMVTVAMKRIELEDKQDDLNSLILCRTQISSSFLTPVACATPRRLYSQHRWLERLSEPTGSNSKSTQTLAIFFQTLSRR